jgi:hypothetical protein
MPLPVIADVFQLRLDWSNTNAPRNASNNLYFRDVAGGQTEANLSTDFQASVLVGMWTPVGTNSVINDFTVTKLDGASAGVVFQTGGAAKWQGSGGSDIILQGCAVVSIKSLIRGPNGRGRIFLPWIGETNQTNGVIVPANVTAMQTAWNSFQVSMAAAGWEVVMVTQHASGGGSAARLANYVCKPNLKTQRRRARR